MTVTILKRNSNYTVTWDIWSEGEVTGFIVRSLCRYLVTRRLKNELKVHLRTESLEEAKEFVRENPELFSPSESDCLPKEPRL